MRIERVQKLLQKLRDEAALELDKAWEAQNQEIIRRNSIRINANRPPPKRPPTKEERGHAQLIRLQKQTAEILNELELKRKTEAEFQRYIVARKRRARKL
jgi:hypothetical protein